MKKWAYLTWDSLEKDTEKFTEIGESGWELVGMVNYASGTLPAFGYGLPTLVFSNKYFFKREKHE